MSFGFSVGDLIATSELLIKAHNSLRDHSSPLELVHRIEIISSSYLEIERIGLDNFTEPEVQNIEEISGMSKSLTMDILRHFPEPTEQERWQNLRRKEKEKGLYLEWAALAGTLAQAVAAVLLENANRRIAAPSVNANTHSARKASPRRVDTRPPRPRTCILIISMVVCFITLSCFLGIYFTVNKSYGYSMGDAFTLAGFVVAVGAMVSSGTMALHYPRCECWGRGKEGRVEMQRLMRESE
ncbi:hypothetical protein GLAREA_10881 [Glarea lozoyensis ATCC 20868]|uniref:Uncharacterized protein n=1 Tax=Glarea lozoyensis (strain ATCC 20868 / MF5171) TaxID=1116229 RepID=S3DBT1_GLAL2|nr:uncharacterized protein GLAREA_10881 [Glarea lozoyensis ATCC 20868]EPE35185.1 hypothetical protein GLAREA_10881 [Glarea lozoyensis ATCC 20868]